jgi:hypothetical protein
MANSDKNRDAQAVEVLRLIGRDPELLAAALHRAQCEGIVLGRAAGLLEAADLAHELNVKRSGDTAWTGGLATSEIESACQARAQLALDGSL